MRRFSKPTTDISKIIAAHTEDPPPSSISVQRLIDDSLVALNREIKNLLLLSTKGKLSANDARDLRDHLKLLFELRDRENDSLKGLTDEELRRRLDEAESPLKDMLEDDSI